MQVSYLATIDVSDPVRPRRAGNTRVTGSTESLTPIAVYNAPFLQNFMLAAGYEGIELLDVNVSSQPNQVSAIEGLRACYAVAVESFAFDRALDEANRPLKDVSHASSRWLELSEIARILRVSGEKLGTLAVPTASSAPAAWTARMDFPRRDADGNGFLEGEELAGVDAAHVDRDGDERVSLAEFAVRAGVVPEGWAAPTFIGESQSRVDLDGDLARLFDGVDPFAFDGDKDARLQRADVERALFAALDLDRDGHLSRAESSRAPGELRQLRFGGQRADRLFKQHDADANGTLEPRELHLRDEDWRALDANKNGVVQLAQRRETRASRRGFEAADVEWPERLPYSTLLPPDITFERLLATFDEDKDGSLSKRELKERPDLLLELDDDGDARVRKGEVEERMNWIAQGGPSACPTGFRERWDLDGDGRVTRAELALPRWLLDRILGAR